MKTKRTKVPISFRVKPETAISIRKTSKRHSISQARYIELLDENRALIRYYQAEGFRIGDARCCDCHFHWVAVIEPQTVAWRLECPACHNPRERGALQSTNHFKEFPFHTPA